LLLRTAVLPFVGSFLCRSQTAMKLTHVLAFCVCVQDDEVCKQWGKKKNLFNSTAVPAKSFPSLLHLPATLPCPRLQSGGDVAGAWVQHRDRCHQSLPPSTGRIWGIPAIPHISSQTLCLAVTNCCVPSQPGSGAARVTDLPEFRHAWCSPPLPIHPDAPTDPVRFCRHPLWLWKVSFSSQDTFQTIFIALGPVFSM